MILFLILAIAFGLVALTAVLVAWGAAAAQSRRTLLHVLAVIVGQRLPLVDGVRAAAAGEPRRLRELMLELARQLDLGAPLGAALRGADRRFPPEALDALDAAERSGTLPAVLRSLARDCYADSGDPDEIPFVSPYLVIMPIAFVAVLLPICLFIVPQLNLIGADFGISNLATTGFAGGIVSLFTKFAAVIVFGVCCLVLLVLQISLLRRRIFLLSRRDSTLLEIFDRIAWSLPGFRGAAESRAMIRQLPILVASIETGHDLPLAARAAALVDANVIAQDRLNQWAREIEAGGDIVGAARRLKFSRPMLIALETGLRNGGLAHALDYLLSYYRAASVHWSRLSQSIMIPVMTISAAIVTSAVMWMIYGTMIRLTNSVMDSI